jgi:hypothetical protein
MTPQAPAEATEVETIVVLGDWFIDENWLVAQQETYTSSHTGNIHYLSKHQNIDKRMFSLCGATEIMVVLKSYFDAKHPGQYSFIGFGAWNRNDDDILHCTLCSDHTEQIHLTPYVIKSLQGVEVKDGKRICPYGSDSCRYQDLNLINLAAGTNVSTNRIVRCYEGYGGGRPRLLYRFDWQLPVSPSDLDYSKFSDLRNRNVTAVIIEDHAKGVITSDSIRALLDVLKSPLSIKWFMRSKQDDPPWLDTLNSKNIKFQLNVIDYKLAEHRHGERKWWYGPNLGRASLELLGNLTGEVVYEHGDQAPLRCRYRSHRAAVLLDDNTAIAKEQQTCFSLYKPAGPKQLINIGRTTLFFISLIAQDLSTAMRARDFGTQASKALQIAFQWSKEASRAWNKEELHFYGSYDDALDSLDQADHGAGVLEAGYHQAWDLWNDSSSGLGIVTSSDADKSMRFQLWRAKGALGRFICVGGRKRDALNDLLAKIAEFNKQSRPAHPFNCLLVSSPGWGKSFLARCLAQHFDMQFLEFSLSQMAATTDLVDCFDSICSAQNMYDKPALVFMDEVNCEIGGHSAMSLLLSPIWGGAFTRAGRTYTISPAVWVFASTEPLAALVDSKKGSDFVSRLNGPVIEMDILSTDHGDFQSPSLDAFRRSLAVDPKSDAHAHDEFKKFAHVSGVFRTDQVYLGVSLLNDMWGPVSKVQKAVLQRFHDLFLINGFRSLEFFVSKFHEIQRGVVLACNMPSLERFPELRRHVVEPQEPRYPKKPTEDMQTLVEIEIEVLA